MGIVITNELFLERLANVHGDKYLALSKYASFREHIQMHCNICGNDWDTTPRNLIGRSCGCPKCAIEAKREKNPEHRIQEIHEDKISLLSPYINAKAKAEFRCNICGHIWHTQTSHILEGHGCPRCQARDHKNRWTLTNEKFLEKLKFIHGDNYSPMEEYKQSRIKIKLHCNLCNYDWMVAPNTLINGYGCPNCNISKGEAKVKAILENNSIQFIQGKTFEDCRNKYVLRYDFALMHNGNLLGLIEYDGVQHFCPVKCFGGVEKFKYTQKNDRIKNDYCQSNNIPLLRIKYNIANVEKLVLDTYKSWLN